MPRRYNPGPALVERQLPDRTIRRHQRIRDERHITMDHRTFIRELPPEVVKELYEANPWAERMAEQHPGSRNEILAMLQEGKEEFGRRHNIDQLINEAFSKIGWAYDVTRIGAKIRELREKTSAELYKSHMDSILLEVNGAKKAVEFQKRNIEALGKSDYSGFFSWFRPLKKFIRYARRIRERRSAIKTLSINMAVLPEFERFAGQTQNNLTRVFNALEAHKTQEGFTKKDMDRYATAFAEVMADWAQFRTKMRRTLIGPCAAPAIKRYGVLGKSYAKQQKKGMKLLELEPTEPFLQVMKEIETGIQRDKKAMRFVRKAVEDTERKQDGRVTTLAAANRIQNQR